MGLPMEASNKPYDWLGTGVYFWEADPQRAREWADEKVARGDYKKAAVVGAAIDLGNCLNLLSREAVDLLAMAYAELAREQRATGRVLPANKSLGADVHGDRVLRLLDRAVIEHLNAIVSRISLAGRPPAPFDTVRGLFSEGAPVYPGAGFREKTHVQIAVRNLDCIKGVFLPR